MIESLFHIHLAATWYMIGVIWFVQLVHYPQFADVGADAWATCHERHMRLTTLVVAPGMLIELGSAIALICLDHQLLREPLFVIGAALIGVTWISTATIQVPMHRALGREFSRRQVQRLVRWNWLRTIAWSARGATLLLFATREVIAWRAL